MKILISNQIFPTKSILFEFLIERSARLETRPPNLRKSNGVAIPSAKRHGSKKTNFDNLIPNYLRTSMFPHNPSIYLTQYPLINSRSMVTKSENFVVKCFILLINPLSAVLFLGIFRDSRTVRPSVADGLPYKTSIPTETFNLHLPAEITCGRSGF